MKFLPALFTHQLSTRTAQRNLKILLLLLLAMAILVLAYSLMFHWLMLWEGRSYSWVTGVYWTLTVMSTLGFGDITFHSDMGRAFSVIVLLSGTLFMLVLLPFTFIEFFYAPWMQSQVAALAPRELPVETAGHVVLLSYGPVEVALIRLLEQRHYPYVVLVPDVAAALRLQDTDIHVVVGERDDPVTYERLRLRSAALLATTLSDMVNTNVALTARSIAERTPLVATARETASVDILELAGCNRVLELSEMMGRGLARRVIGRDAKSHVIGQVGGLLIAEASAADTPLVNRTLREIRLPEHAQVNVVGVWERGEFSAAGPDTRILASTVLLLAGTRAQLDDYDALFCIYRAIDAPVVIIGGGRVGQACAQEFVRQKVHYRIIERDPDATIDPERLVKGNAADLEVLRRGGLMESPAVVITTNDDDMNIYLTLYCRRLRPDIQIISRSTVDRNVDTLHRAGADFVMSYASIGANAIFNLLRRHDVLLLAEGLSAFEVDIPPSLGGRTLGETTIREATGCNVVAIKTSDGMIANPPPNTQLPTGAQMILIGSADNEKQYTQRFVDS